MNFVNFVPRRFFLPLRRDTAFNPLFAASSSLYRTEMHLLGRKLKENSSITLCVSCQSASQTLAAEARLGDPAEKAPVSQKQHGPLCVRGSESPRWQVVCAKGVLL